MTVSPARMVQVRFTVCPALNEYPLGGTLKEFGYCAATSATRMVLMMVYKEKSIVVDCKLIRN